MTADDLLTRLRGRLTAEALREMASTESGMSCDCGLDYMDDGHGWNGVQQRILDALRPECEAIAREMVEVRETWERLHDHEQQGWRESESKLIEKLQAADADRAALRQALQRVINTWKDERVRVAEFDAALKSAEATAWKMR